MARQTLTVRFHGRNEGRCQGILGPPPTRCQRG
eukprot:CAMPEP_0198694944 /NCGR_PEP_ID=MMETSP1468-20131203/279306_1 /TAXON_ID=1461545 /ORGANISM="Mantoniella sp, Strain CCMP1436" /LENGTH=32 /DNA_ID= /DNA_START= /DNA_END= /DNA_ORIENTATION=